MLDPTTADVGPVRSCPFCSPEVVAGAIATSELVLAIFDRFPVSPGHVLVIPRRHVAGWFDLTHEEQCAAVTLAAEVRGRLETELRPAGWNLGVNVGAAGGQTVGHVHLHVIPRYAGDRDDPRGGVRWILPERAAYWDGSAASE